MILNILKDYCARIRAEGEEAGRNRNFLAHSDWSYLALLPFGFVLIVAVIFKPEALLFRIFTGVIGIICVSAYSWAMVIFLIAYVRGEKVRRTAEAKAKAENTGKP